MNIPLERVVADSVDREAWHAVRSTGIGASDAASFSKLDSVEKYVRAKLKDRTFKGNAYTEAGHLWEPAVLAADRFEHNTLMYRSVDEPGYLATPDGIRVAADGVLELAEVKTLLVREYTDDWTPHVDPSKRRQVAWAQMVLGAQRSRLLCLPCGPDHKPLSLLPTVVVIDRDDDLIHHLLTIARPVLAAMRAAALFERTLHS